jgi:chromosome segregation ATPase
MARTTTPERLREQAQNSLDAANSAVTKAQAKYDKANEKVTAYTEARDTAEKTLNEAKTKVAELQRFVTAATEPPAQVVNPDGAESGEVHGEVGGSAEVTEPSTDGTEPAADGTPPFAEAAPASRGRRQAAAV